VMHPETSVNIFVVRQRGEDSNVGSAEGCVKWNCGDW